MALFLKHALRQQIEAQGEERAHKKAFEEEMEWTRFKSKKGYSPESLNILFYEFIREKELFGELTKFVQKKGQ